MKKRENKNEKISIRVTSAFKQEILKYCYDNDVSITELFLKSTKDFMKNNKRFY